MDINGPADIRWDGERVKHEKVMQFRSSLTHLNSRL